MERLLHRLFDYQRFARNENLQRLIDDTESRYVLENHRLHDDMLELNAAGDIFLSEPKGPEDEY